MGAVRRRFARDAEAGQGLAEYALILAFVALICVGALGVLGNAIANSPGFALF
jgi:Flp pilus assembly pilin Flp